MVEHPDIDQRERLPQSIRERPIRLGGLGKTGGVIVREEHGGCVMPETLPDHLARMHHALIDRAGEEDFGCENPVVMVKIGDRKDFLGKVCKLHPEVLRTPGWRIERVTCALEATLQYPQRLIQEPLLRTGSDSGRFRSDHALRGFGENQVELPRSRVSRPL